MCIFTKKIFLIILRAKPWNLIFWYNPNKHNHFPIIWSPITFRVILQFFANKYFYSFSPYSWIVRNSVWENDRKQDAQNCIFFFVSNSKTCPKSKTLFYESSQHGEQKISKIFREIKLLFIFYFFIFLAQY